MHRRVRDNGMPERVRVTLSQRRKTKRRRAIALLRKIEALTEKEMVYALKAGWLVGTERVFAPDAYYLITQSLVSRDQVGSDREIERYTVTPAGKALLSGPA